MRLTKKWEFNMIQEELVTHEVAKLAKEKGFDGYEACNHLYEVDEQWYTLTKYNNAKGIDWSKSYFYAAPTQSLLQRWLREEKNLEVNAFWDNREQVWLGYAQQMYMPDLTGTFPLEGKFTTYEQALEDALKYALKNLV